MCTHPTERAADEPIRSASSTFYAAVHSATLRPLVAALLTSAYVQCCPVPTFGKLMLCCRTVCCAMDHDDRRKVEAHEASKKKHSKKEGKKPIKKELFDRASGRAGAPCGDVQSPDCMSCIDVSGVSVHQLS